MKIIVDTLFPPSRLRVRTVRCPECGAKPGKRCWKRKKGQKVRRTANHQSRVEAYLYSELPLEVKIRLARVRARKEVPVGD